MIAARHSALQHDVPARRMLIALGASLLAHFLMMGNSGGSGAARAVLTVLTPLQARLELMPGALPPAPEVDAPLVTAAKQPVISPRRPSPVTAPVVAVDPSPAGAAGSGPDPRFYLARELDQYPSALSALSLDDGRGTAGSARLWVSIDQAGRVVDVGVIDADPPGEFERLARERVLATRFVPARRDGRPVKSRILLVMGGGI